MLEGGFIYPQSFEVPKQLGISAKTFPVYKSIQKTLPEMKRRQVPSAFSSVLFYLPPQSRDSISHKAVATEMRGNIVIFQSD